MIGSIELNTKFGHEGFEHKTIKIKYVVGTSYDVLLEWPTLNTLSVVVSTPHLAMKFPSVVNSIIIVHAYQKKASECYMARLQLTHMAKGKSYKDINNVEMLAGSS